MRAVIIEKPGGPEVLKIVDMPDPECGPDEVLVRNFATSLNRADLLQRRGVYPPPNGESNIPGLEYAGEILAVGEQVQNRQVGDRVFGLVPAGGYAEIVSCDHRMLLDIPDTFSFEKAAAVPDIFYSSFQNLLVHGALKKNQTALIHAGGSGIGTAAIQLARDCGAKTIITTRFPFKLECCAELGANRCINSLEEDFEKEIFEYTKGQGVDLIFDSVGAAHWQKNLACLKTGGRLVLSELVSSSMVNLTNSPMLRHRIVIQGTIMRGLPLEEKRAITEDFRRHVLPKLAAGTVGPVIDKVFPFEDVQAAHDRMEVNANLGKIILRL